MSPGFDLVERLTLDCFLAVIEYLDVQSIVRLSMISKLTMIHITECRVIWLKALQSILEQECAPPFSLPNIEALGARDLMLHATRPFRMRYSIINNRFLRPSHTAFQLGPLPIPHDYTALHLCSGGRWLISISFDGRYQHVCCWDMECLEEQRSNIQPVAQLRLRALGPYTSEHGLRVIAQSRSAGRQVAILVPSEHGHSQTYEIMLLTWPQSEDKSPVLESCSSITLEDILSTNGDWDPSPTLEGDFVCIQTMVSTYIWNWRENTWAVVDYLGHEQLDALYNVWLQPPFVYALPRRAQCFTAFRIPPLGPITDAPLHYVPSLIEFPLSFVEPDLNAYSYIAVTGVWKPHQLRHTLIHVNVISHARARDRLIVINTSTNGDDIAAPIVICSHDSLPAREAEPLRLSPDMLTMVQRQLIESPDRTMAIDMLATTDPSKGLVQCSIPTGLPASDWSSSDLRGDICTISGRMLISQNLSSSIHALVHFE